MKPFYRIVFVLCLSVMIASAQDSTDFIPVEPCETGGELSMWIWSAAWEPLIQASIDNWIAEYCPSATVNLRRITFAEYWPALQNAVANGTLPDLFHLNHVFFRDFVTTGAILNLQPYYDAANVDTTRWNAGAVDAYRWGESEDLHAAPVNVDTVAIYYNKALFDSAGIAYPNVLWDWDDFIGYAALLTSPDEGVYGAAVYPSYQSGYSNWIAATGQAPIINSERTACTLTEPNSLEALQMLRDLYDSGFMPSIDTLSRLALRDGLPAGSNLSENATELFLQGKVAMLAQGSWRLPIVLRDADFEWGLLPLPRYPQASFSSSLLHSVGYVVANTSANPDLAVNLLFYLASEQGQEGFARAGGVAPGHPSVRLFNLWFTSLGDLDVDVEAFGTSLVNTQGFTVFNEIWNFANVEFERIFLDPALTVEEAALQGCTMIEPFLTPSN